MSTLKPRVGVATGLVRRALIISTLAALAAACTSGAAVQPSASVAGATETPTQTASATPTVPASPSDSATPTATPSPTDSSTTQPTNPPTNPPTKLPTAAPTPAPTKPPTPKPTPTQNPLAIGLCPAAQLKLTITSWQNSGDSYAHVTATNVSSASCNMRGSSRAQVLDGHGQVIADAGSSAATVSSSDPVYPVAPNGTINTILDWGNWCTSAPAQNVTVQMVLAFGLGTIKAAAIGPAPIPSCLVNTQKTSLSSEAWLP